jgi:transcriptional regulator with XRE-family HTH domain
VPTWQSTANRGASRARYILRRVGEELRRYRVEAGLSTRHLGRIVGISHTQVRRRVEAGLAGHIDIDLLARMASALGAELTIGVHLIGTPVRDKAHIALLRRFAGRLATSIRWRTEVPIPLAGDPRSADGVASGGAYDAVIEAETRLDDVQAVVRRLRAKQRDLGTTRAILLVADTRHNREVLRAVPDLHEQFPVRARDCLLALGRDEDPGGDCILLM